MEEEEEKKICDKGVKREPTVAARKLLPGSKQKGHRWLRSNLPCLSTGGNTRHTGTHRRNEAYQTGPSSPPYSWNMKSRYLLPSFSTNIAPLSNVLPIPMSIKCIRSNERRRPAGRRESASREGVENLDDFYEGCVCKIVLKIAHKSGIIAQIGPRVQAFAECLPRADMHMHSNRAANARMHPPPSSPPPPPPPPFLPPAGRRLAVRLCEWESSGMQSNRMIFPSPSRFIVPLKEDLRILGEELKRHDRQRRIRFTRSSSTSIPTDLQSWRALVIRFTERLYVRQQHHQQQQHSRRSRSNAP
ncbi:hypothetical protein V1477_020003 [Vespula maculifrons]|uniref:Uncharacterized protein n=1 Tax=Vespula maculifrons TaxID=7453 RepID=A0ABD2AKQ8_VESMC